MREKLSVKTSSTHKELTDSGKSNHAKNVNSLKEKLRSYKIDPFSDGPAKVVCTGAEVDARIICDVLNAPATGNERYKEYVKNRLFDGKESFFSPIKKLKLHTGIQKPKKTPKAVSILKEDRQAFGILVGKAASIEEAFAYPITTIPLSLATPGGELRQGDKAALRNFMIKESNSDVKTPPENARWIIDGMALFRSIKPKETYSAWFKSAIRCANPPRDAKAIKVEIVNDQYLENSTKASTRQKRGESSKRVHIESVEQKMPQGKNWEEFFHNDANKENLIRIAAKFFRSAEGRELLTIPLIITCGEGAWEISKSNVKVLPKCNHEEADTRIILHAISNDTPVVIVAKDTDVFVLLLYAIQKCKPTNEWFMCINNEKIVTIRGIAETFGSKICCVLPQIHAITGCDTTAYKHNVGKVTLMKKLMRNEKQCAFI